MRGTNDTLSETPRFVSVVTHVFFDARLEVCAFLFADAALAPAHAAR